MPAGSRTQGNRRVVLVAVILVLGLGVTFSVARRSMQMASAMAAATDSSAFAQAAPGSQVQAVVQIVAMSGSGAAEGKLLERESDEVYKRTAAQVKLQFNDATPVVMGKLTDLRAGAVVHVKGTVGTDHTLRAGQIVILTPYVQVH